MTMTCANPSSSLTRTSIGAAPYLIAFETRLPSICCTRVGSARTQIDGRALVVQLDPLGHAERGAVDERCEPDRLDVDGQHSALRLGRGEQVAGHPVEHLRLTLDRVEHAVERAGVDRIAFGAQQFGHREQHRRRSAQLVRRAGERCVHPVEFGSRRAGRVVGAGHLDHGDARDGGARAA